MFEYNIIGNRGEYNFTVPLLGHLVLLADFGATETFAPEKWNGQVLVHQEPPAEWHVISKYWWDIAGFLSELNYLAGGLPVPLRPLHKEISGLAPKDVEDIVSRLHQIYMQSFSTLEKEYSRSSKPQTKPYTYIIDLHKDDF